MSATRTERIRELLTQAFAAAEVEVRDDSHHHLGHEGARGGAGHYHVRVVAERFSGHSRLQRHQMVYAALAPMMKGEIHALGIDARTPDEP